MICRPVLAHGSSPRVRGTRVQVVRDGADGRFIPACAGNSPPCEPCARATPVHPRVCGELALAVFNDNGTIGSSPRVRGTLRRLELGEALERFIPACAGNSAAHAEERLDVAVHPRVCGELALHRADGHVLRRFIPACAGNSPAPSGSAGCCTGSSPRVRGTRRRRALSPPRSAVHPRVCGELPWSTPKVRRPRRFIPACAGNSLSAASTLFKQSVHPRVCGELCDPADAFPDEDGSSPRVRGTLRRWRTRTG